MNIIKVWQPRTLTFIFVKKLVFGKVIYSDKNGATKFTDKSALKLIERLGLNNHIVSKEV